MVIMRCNNKNIVYNSLLLHWIKSNLCKQTISIQIFYGFMSVPYASMYLYMSVYTYVYMHTSMYAWKCTSVHMYAYTYECLCVCTCVHMYVCIRMLHACMHWIYNMWLSLQKGSYTCNYKYLEIQFWNIQFNVSREWLEMPACISPQIYSCSK